MSSQAGVFYFDQRPVPSAILDELVRALGVCDVDARGVHEDAGLFMAHAATWIDDIAAMERQPHTSPIGNVISFDGRLDNRDDLLLRFGRSRCRQATDPALAIAAYEASGSEGFVNLIGDWSAIVWEPTTRALTAASDYASVRPLYYHVNQERVIWSSYLKPLVKLADANEIDDLFVAGFLTSNGAPERTPYRGILSVPAGQAVRFEAGIARRLRFWDLPVKNQIRYADERDYDEHLRVLVRDSVRARLRTSFPACSDLSGGLDSSLVVCVAQQLISQDQAAAPKIVSVSYESTDSADRKFFNAVRDFCGVENLTVDTGKFPYLSQAHLEEEATPAAWGPLCEQLSGIAKAAGAKTYLTGLGGDTIMGNWIDDSEQLASPLREGRFAKALSEAIGWSKATRVPVPHLIWRAFLAGLPPELVSSKRFEPQAAITPSGYGDSLTPAFRSKTGVADPDWIGSQRWKEAPPERRKHFKTVSQTSQSGFFRPPERLRHLYQTHPYAHRPLVEFLLSIPADVLCRPNEPRRLMRRAFGDALPPEVVRRRSKASYTGTFLESTRPAARLLLDGRKPLHVVEQGYIKDSEIRMRLRRLIESLECNEPQLRQVVLLESWLRSRRAGSSHPVLNQFPLAIAADF